MKRWQVIAAAVLAALSITLYLVDYLIFRSPAYILRNVIESMAVLPLNFLLVTLVIERVLEEQEKAAMLQKMNMVIGAFFSEVGSGLLRYLNQFDANCPDVRSFLLIQTGWSEKDFDAATAALKGYQHDLQSTPETLTLLKDFLPSKRGFLLRLLENPNLLEHEAFTDLLRAVFHLTEELTYRNDVRQLPAADYAHLRGDMARAYVLLIAEWLAYMRYLRASYPYLYSLAVRLNPFDPAAQAEIADKG